MAAPPQPMMLSATSQLLNKLSSWLDAHDSPQPTSHRSCYDPRLELPSPCAIIDAIKATGVSQSVSQNLSDLYISSATRLALSTEEEYRLALHDLDESHTILCPQPTADLGLRLCTLSSKVRDTFTRIFQRKTRAMVDHLVNLARTAAKSGKQSASSLIVDYAAVLEFAFSQSPKPSPADKALLARVTGRSLKQVSVWFQNRRTRTKAGVTSRKPGPQTLEELGEKLRENQRLEAEFRARQKIEDDSGNESHDSGYASADSRSTSIASVQDITNMLKGFHIGCDNDVVRKTKSSVSARKGSGPENVDSRRPPVRPKTLKPKRVSTQQSCALRASSSPEVVTPQGAAPQRAVARMPRRVATHPTSDAASPPTVSPSSSRPSGARVSAAVSTTAAANEAGAASSNKAARGRKKPALPTRRPKASKSTRGVQAASSSSSGSSLPSLSPSSSRSSSLSSDPFLDLFSSPTPFSASLPQTEPVYYTKNANGEFVPVTAPIVVRPQIAVPPPVHVGYPDLSLDLPSLFDHPSLGPVGPQMVAPDSDPRAFSSNILGSTMEPVITTEDFSALLELLSENAGDASTSGTSALDLSSAMPPLQGPPLNAGHDASSIASVLDPTSLTVLDYDFGSVVWPEFDETSWSQLLGLA
ncbi:hypothetical protein EXIGLDRAFT_831784 [Exidia glandulosa HHB12029]|uniref:Homeobox domain-containing protein n=1 Tax=Exidia glandulosa HHB12029 TaxID=1314781 RepID=A0A165MAW8_EXIGL|nr:hypothetical protein EXIGLDRAFT_831784 [Exidia glandulosa HHB12029]